MKEIVKTGLLVVTITGSGLSLADCPNTMPTQLLEDCIVYEDAGTTFPPEEYARMDLYSNWLEEQQQNVQGRQVGMSSLEVK